MILFHQKQLQYLRKIFLSGKIPHAFLFSGQRGLGKKRVAMEFLSWIFERPLKNHPDFILVEPEKNQIKIEKIRDLIAKLSLTPSLAKIKGAILDRAELMTLEAQNCFLKTLEEPKNSIIILISENPKLILPTIVSRCQLIKFFPAKRKEMEEFLKRKGLEKEKIEKILKISRGRPEIAIELIENEKKLKKIENLENTLEKIKNLGISERFRLANDLLKEFKIFEILEILAQNFREKLFSQKDFKFLKILKEIQKIYFLTSTTNLDQRLALEKLFLEI